MITHLSNRLGERIDVFRDGVLAESRVPPWFERLGKWVGESGHAQVIASRRRGINPSDTMSARGQRKRSAAHVLTVTEPMHWN